MNGPQTDSHVAVLCWLAKLSATRLFPQATDKDDKEKPKYYSNI